jgi:hypothetical protein
LGVSETVPSLERRPRKERQDLRCGEIDFLEGIQQDLLKPDPSKRQIDTMESQPVKLELPV